MGPRECLRMQTSEICVRSSSDCGMASGGMPMLEWEGKYGIGRSGKSKGESCSRHEIALGRFHMPGRSFAKGRLAAHHHGLHYTYAQLHNFHLISSSVQTLSIMRKKVSNTNRRIRRYYLFKTTRR